MRFSFLILFLLFVHFANAQNTNNDYYKYGVSPSDLPSYLLDSVNIFGSDVSFGISDPDLDSATAINQAIYRAQAMFNLSHFVKVQTLTSYFKSESYSGDGGSFQSYSRISNLDTCFHNYTVIDTFFTRFKEAIVRLKFIENDLECESLNVVKADSIVNKLLKDSINFHNFEVEKFVMEYEWGEDAEPESQIDISEQFFDSAIFSQTIDIFEYSGNFDVNNIINEQEEYFPELRYNYKNGGKSEQFFKYGIWVHFVKKLQDMLVAESKLRSEKVEKLDENFRDNVSINRGLAANILSYNIRNIYLLNGEVHISIDYLR